MPQKSSGTNYSSTRLTNQPSVLNSFLPVSEGEQSLTSLIKKKCCLSPGRAFNLFRLKTPSLSLPKGRRGKSSVLSDCLQLTGSKSYVWLTPARIHQAYWLNRVRRVYWGSQMYSHWRNRCVVSCFARESLQRFYVNADHFHTDTKNLKMCFLIYYSTQFINVLFGHSLIAMLSCCCQRETAAFGEISLWWCNQWMVWRDSNTCKNGSYSQICRCDQISNMSNLKICGVYCPSSKFDSFQIVMSILSFTKCICVLTMCLRFMLWQHTPAPRCSFAANFLKGWSFLECMNSITLTKKCKARIGNVF